MPWKNVLHSVSYAGSVAYEMCSRLRGGGSEPNLDRCARRFLDIAVRLDPE
jgi:hypothetical protein